jgi:hypothetical protein
VFRKQSYFHCFGRPATAHVASAAVGRATTNAVEFNP